jgi:hypothetical protein
MIDAPDSVRKEAHRMIEAIRHLSTAQVQAAKGMMHLATADATFPTNETKNEAAQLDASARKMLDQVLQGRLASAEETAVELGRETEVLEAHDPDYGPPTSSTKLAEFAFGNADRAAESSAVDKSLTNTSCTHFNAPNFGWPCSPCECLDIKNWCERNCGASNCGKNVKRYGRSHWCWLSYPRGLFLQGAVLDKHVAMGAVDERGKYLGNMRNDDLKKRAVRSMPPGQALALLDGPLLTRSGARDRDEGKLIERDSQDVKFNASIHMDLDASVGGKACM